MELLMKDHQIACRSLTVVSKAGESRNFDLTIGSPFDTGDGEYCCELNSEDVLFRGKQKAFGADSIDALDYAIQLMDAATTEFKEGVICWPDGTPYKRVPSGRKMEWGR